ncbi:hypothetical protein [Bradyrhizobium arachidis]|uniref:hypothetical protein n=1 Tax=Bradyrhizobium arachidis TaxID=858423 RepID=UPI0008E30D52|nr:hypothetical protein [Bradyrhizobium arachidis]SFV11295.1 hypothetical protein SAMN05192541_11711 [Bradyrhizobium arachidis]
MTALATYSTGTATVSAGGTTVTGIGTIWSGTNVKPGDIFQVGNFQSVISDVTDTTHLVIPPWGGGAQTGVAYTIWQVSPQRFAGAQAMQTVNELVAAFEVSGFFWFVDVGLMAPDPSYGNDGQWAYQPSTGAYWLKTGGVWVSSGSPAAGYGGTSTTSLIIGTGSKAFTTQSGLGYNGARVRAAAASDATKWMEGVATYSGTTLTISVDKTNGSGTFANWTFAIAGQPGPGDMVAANNLSDVASPAAALKNLGTPAVLRSYLAGLTLSTAGSSSSFGVAAGVATDSTNVDFLSLASAYAKTTGAWAVGSGNGALDTGTIASSAWYHVFLIKRPDTGVVDVLISLSATSPTLPANYTLFRRIGSLCTAASQWIKFTQLGDEFIWDVSTLSLNASPVGDTLAHALTVNVPTSVKVTAILSVGGIAGSGADGRVYISEFDKSDEAPGNSNLNAGVQGSTALQGWQRFLVRTNASAQIRYRAFNATGQLIVNTQGWIDRRGRDG